jgi:hypothetical protein
MSSAWRDGSQFWGTDGPELLRELNETTEQIRVLEARRLELVAKLGRIQAHDAAGYSSLPAFLIQTQRVSMGTAKQWVTHAQQITETLTPTGHVTPAPLPTARVAVLAGAIGAEHLEVITKTVEALPTSVSVADREVVEQSLADYARTAPPNAVLKLGEALVSHLDPDGQEPQAKELAEPKNRVRWHHTPTGRMQLTADLDKETGAALEKLFDQLGPRTSTDTRHQTERHGDVLAEVIHLAAKSGGDAKPSMLVALDYDTLKDAVGTATLADTNTVLSPYAARRIACDADIIPVVFNGDSVPLDQGRKYRCITAEQRTTLIARDHGCAFPDCNRAPKWCDGHHIRPWTHGGLTDQQNLVLLCRRHHQVIHHSEWQVRIGSSGLPEFLPPRWLDPAQAPRRNRLHQSRV